MDAVLTIATVYSIVIILNADEPIAWIGSLQIKNRKTCTIELFIEMNLTALKL